MYYHPNHYKKLKASSRKPYRSRPTVINRIHDSWATDHGYGSKDQAIQETVPWNEVLEATSSQASSSKLQAPRTKLQAPSRKRQAPRSVNQKTFE
jgi:hypothetical protein